MESAIGETPDYPRFGRAEFEFSRVGPLTDLRIIFEYPLQFGGGALAVKE